MSLLIGLFSLIFIIVSATVVFSKKIKSNTEILGIHKNLAVNAPVAGSILKYTVNEGEEVQEGSTILIFESMKMELEIKTTASGKIHFLVPVGRLVQSKQPIACINPVEQVDENIIEKPQIQTNSIDSTFVDILNKIVEERGFSFLSDCSKCKSLLQDYTSGNYKKETRLLLLAIEAKCPNEILNTSEPDITMNKLINKLKNEYSVENNAAEMIVKLLFNLYNNIQKK